MRSFYQVARGYILSRYRDYKLSKSYDVNVREPIVKLLLNNDLMECTFTYNRMDQEIEVLAIVDGGLRRPIQVIHQTLVNGDPDSFPQNIVHHQSFHEDSDSAFDTFDSYLFGNKSLKKSHLKLKGDTSDEQ